jgi:ubiquitin-conjugating enzyme E2 Z
MGSEKEAASYISKIRHETLRISVIQRLEGYLKPEEDPGVPTPPVESDDEEDGRRSVTPIEPSLGMFVDQCKRLFLWYYDIYMVSPIPPSIPWDFHLEHSLGA